MAHEIKSKENLLIIDDSLESKLHMKTNNLITWHYDNCKGKSVKGVNFVSCFYYSPNYDIGLPVGIEYVKKDKAVISKNGKVTYKSKKTGTR